jgi:DNA replication protein DnaC
MFQLINHRYTRRLPAVITTNDFTRSESRVIDRICDEGLSKLVQIRANSFRLRERKAFSAIKLDLDLPKSVNVPKES